jgi:hypothetical protein
MVAALIGVVFLFGGIAQLVVASRAPGWRWLYIRVGILGVDARISPSSDPGLTLYVAAIAELVLGVWAVHSWQRSLFTLVSVDWTHPVASYGRSMPWARHRSSPRRQAPLGSYLSGPAGRSGRGSLYRRRSTLNASYLILNYETDRPSHSLPGPVDTR